MFSTFGLVIIVCLEVADLKICLKLRIEGVKHPCGQCGHQFTSKRNLAEHRKAKPEGVIRHPCVHCNRQFNSKSNLKRHQKNLHKAQ